jgi:hypothetical protein
LLGTDSTSIKKLSENHLIYDFDFGDIFINLDKEAPRVAFKKLGLKNMV